MYRGVMRDRPQPVRRATVVRMGSCFRFSSDRVDLGLEVADAEAHGRSRRRRGDAVGFSSP